MAEFIKTRNALQCRSHYQKLMQKHKYTKKIISEYKLSHSLDLFEHYVSLLQNNAQSQPTAIMKGEPIKVETA